MTHTQQVGQEIPLKFYRLSLWRDLLVQLAAWEARQTTGAVKWKQEQLAVGRVYEKQKDS